MSTLCEVYGDELHGVSVTPLAQRLRKKLEKRNESDGSTSSAPATREVMDWRVMKADAMAAQLLAEEAAAAAASKSKKKKKKKKKRPDEASQVEASQVGASQVEGGMEGLQIWEEASAEAWEGKAASSEGFGEDLDEARSCDDGDDGEDEEPEQPTPPAAVRADEPPEELICPLSHELMVDPVILGSGQTYERKHIERWLASHNTDPMTGARLESRNLTENVLVRSMCRKYGKSSRAY